MVLYPGFDDRTHQTGILSSLVNDCAFSIRHPSQQLAKWQHDGGREQIRYHHYHFQRVKVVVNHHRHCRNCQLK